MKSIERKSLSTRHLPDRTFGSFRASKSVDRQFWQMFQAKLTHHFILVQRSVWGVASVSQLGEQSLLGAGAAPGPALPQGSRSRGQTDRGARHRSRVGVVGRRYHGRGSGRALSWSASVVLVGTPVQAFRGSVAFMLDLLLLLLLQFRLLLLLLLLFKEQLHLYRAVSKARGRVYHQGDHARLLLAVVASGDLTSGLGIQHGWFARWHWLRADLLTRYEDLAHFFRRFVHRTWLVGSF